MMIIEIFRLNWVFFILSQKHLLTRSFIPRLYLICNLYNFIKKNNSSELKSGNKTEIDRSLDTNVCGRFPSKGTQKCLTQIIRGCVKSSSFRTITEA